MSVIPDQYINSVLSIGVSNSNEHDDITWIGSGFFVSKRLSEDSTKARIFVVTNRHVIDGKKAVTLRLKKKDGSFVQYTHELLGNGIPQYSTSDDPKVDVAVFTFVAGIIEQFGIDINFIDIDANVATTNEFLSGGGGEGSLVYMLGYPMGLVNIESNTPICRLGCVARMDEYEINKEKKILLDIQNFPGNSGSPILTRPEVMSVGGAKPFDRSVLLGIICSYIPYRDWLISKQTGEIVEIRTENSGIANCIPVEFIREVIDKEMNRNKQP